jgi:hypothetical protein
VSPLRLNRGLDAWVHDRTPLKNTRHGAGFFYARQDKRADVHYNARNRDGRSSYRLTRPALCSVLPAGRRAGTPARSTLMPRLRFFWKLVKTSFHGTFRFLEIGEALVALVVHGLGWLRPAWKEPLETLFVALIGLLILTFFFGLFLAAYAQNKETENERDQLAARLQFAEKQTGTSPKQKQNVETLRKLIARLENCKQWLGFQTNDPHFLKALKTIYPLDEEIQAFLDKEMPDKLPEYLGQFFIPTKSMQVSGGELLEFCGRKISALQQIEGAM